MSLIFLASSLSLSLNLLGRQRAGDHGALQHAAHLQGRGDEDHRDQRSRLSLLPLLLQDCRVQHDRARHPGCVTVSLASVAHLVIRPFSYLILSGLSLRVPPGMLGEDKLEKSGLLHSDGKPKLEGQLDGGDITLNGDSRFPKVS